MYLYLSKDLFLNLLGKDFCKCKQISVNEILPFVLDTIQLYKHKWKKISLYFDKKKISKDSQ